MVADVTATRRTGRTGRAAPMAPDERRRAIVDAVVPLLLASGDDVTTRQIAEAAGIAEGTIFRVFPDKSALLMAAAEEVINPASGRADLESALAGADSLPERVRITAERLASRSEKVMAVMMALRRIWMSQPPGTHEHGADPQKVFAAANEELHAMLTDVFEPHRDELTVDPATAAVLLRTLVLGSRHPGANPRHRLTPAQITDALLDGVRTHTPTKEA
jgi:AcrR family transcriptional regulator